MHNIYAYTSRFPTNFGVRESKSRLGRDCEVEDKFSMQCEMSTINSADAFKAWGYMPDHQHFQLGHVALTAGFSSEHRDQKALLNISKGSDKALNCQRPVRSGEIESAINIIPPRSVAGMCTMTSSLTLLAQRSLDSLVQNFLLNVNYQYYAIYPPVFLNEYTQWWTDRAGGQRLAPEVTCLLLRMCSCSMQYLTRSMRQDIEFELGENAQSLAERYHRAAERLSRSFTPGSGGLAQVQQLFLTASWFKTEALFVESWHALSSAIREAQELGVTPPVVF
jgi:hypothetical protein